jgi:hypothetical protein
MRSRFVVLAFGFILLHTVAFAEVTKVSITTRGTVANGQAFGAAGPYQRLSGTIEFALDPKDLHNARIVDLDRAPRASDGRVHFTSDLYVLQPVDASKGNGVILVEVVNRGRKGLLGTFDGAAPSNAPATSTELGDGFLLREGYTLVFVGWEFDVAPPLMHLDAPPASGVSGRISVRFTLNEHAADATLNDAREYSPVNPDDPSSSLTVRRLFWDTPSPIARTKWHFVRPQSGAPAIVLDGGFEPGLQYELTYNATGARVVGAGMAAIRDVASAFRYRTDLPVHGRTAYAFGVSQDGRFLREFLYDGFNVDEHGRRAFDAVWAHIAGAARGSFNERFGEPVSEAPFVPTKFPFSDEDETLDGQHDGLLAAYTPEQRPKIFYTNTPVEYWGGGRAAALIHTSPDGRRDLTPPDDVRIYLLSSTEHGPAPFPPPRRFGQELLNPVPQREVMRALLRALHQWTANGVVPPPSRYPRLSDGTLVPATQVRFPAIPGVADPRTIVGPALVRNGRVEKLPFLVPQVDADGNDIAGIRVPDVSVPVATNTGWNFRANTVGNPQNIYYLLGSYIPFAATRAERERRHDPRPSIEERYRGRDDYLQKLRTAAEALVRERYMLEEDIDSVIKRGEAQWDFVTGPVRATR